MVAWLLILMINAIVGEPTIGTLTKEVVRAAPIILWLLSFLSQEWHVHFSFNIVFALILVSVLLIVKRSSSKIQNSNDLNNEKGKQHSDHPIHPDAIGKETI